MAWILYLVGALMLFNIPDPDIAAWGFFIFLAGMLIHWKYWLAIIGGFLIGFNLFRN